MDKQNSRRDMRTPITLKIKFKSASLGQFIERYSVDVSRSGIFIRTKEPLAVGTQLKFEFQLQDASSLIGGEGTVVWTREHDPMRSGVAPGMGVRFDKLSGNSQQVLDQILSEKQRRGDAAVESRFDAGVRASQSASGVLGDRETTPLPRPMPGLPVPDTGGFDNEESTRVMKQEETQRLAERTRGDEAAAAKEMTTSVMGLGQMQTLAAQTAGARGGEVNTSVLAAPTADALIAATREAEATEKDLPARQDRIEVVEPPRPAPRQTPAPQPPAPAARSSMPAAAPRRSSPATTLLLLALVAAAGAGVYYYTRADEKPPNALASQPPQQPVVPPPVEKPVPPPVEKPAVPAGLEVQITSAPPGATAMVDGKLVDGLTPTKITGLEAGKAYAVEVTLKGYKPYRKELHAAAGASWEAKLDEAEKVIEVTSVPEGATILLDGKAVGRTGKAAVELKLGGPAKPHTLELSHAGFVKSERKIAVDEPFESKGDKEVLTVAANLVAVEKPAPAQRPHPLVRKPVKPVEKPTETALKPEEKPVEKPTETAAKPEEKPVEKAKPPEEKPKAVEKPEEKPAPENKPPVEKAADKPSAAPIKVPAWMKPKAGSGESETPPPQP